MRGHEKRMALIDPHPSRADPPTVGQIAGQRIANLLCINRNRARQDNDGCIAPQRELANGGHHQALHALDLLEMFKRGPDVVIAAGRSRDGVDPDHQHHKILRQWATTESPSCFLILVKRRDEPAYGSGPQCIPAWERPGNSMSFPSVVVTLFDDAGICTLRPMPRDDAMPHSPSGHTSGKALSRSAAYVRRRTSS